MSKPDTQFVDRFTAAVTGVHEHSRTIRGRRDSHGQAYTETISLGWFLHVDFDGDGTGEISFGGYTQRPPVRVGDLLEFTVVNLGPPPPAEPDAPVSASGPRQLVGGSTG